MELWLLMNTKDHRQRDLEIQPATFDEQARGRGDQADSKSVGEGSNPYGPAMEKVI